MKVLAERLRQQRVIALKTQDEMARLLNVKRATYGEYERGKNLPPIDKLKTIANYFGVSVDYLIGNNDKSFSANEIIQQLDVIKMIACTIENTLKD